MGERNAFSSSLLKILAAYFDLCMQIKRSLDILSKAHIFPDVSAIFFFLKQASKKIYLFPIYRHMVCRHFAQAVILLGYMVFSKQS